MSSAPSVSSAAAAESCSYASPQRRTAKAFRPLSSPAATTGVLRAGRRSVERLGDVAGGAEEAVAVVFDVGAGQAVAEADEEERERDVPVGAEDGCAHGVDP